MSLSFHAGPKTYEVGTASLLKALFSTIYVRLEGAQWGSRFPTLMNKLYMGQVGTDDCDAAIRELLSAKEALAKHPPAEVVWDFEDLSKQPPWGTRISPTINSLANYFQTSDGKELLAVLAEALREGRSSRTGVRIG